MHMNFRAFNKTLASLDIGIVTDKISNNQSTIAFILKNSQCDCTLNWQARLILSSKGASSKSFNFNHEIAYKFEVHHISQNFSSHFYTFWSCKLIMSHIIHQIEKSTKTLFPICLNLISNQLLRTWLIHGIIPDIMSFTPSNYWIIELHFSESLMWSSRE